MTKARKSAIDLSDNQHDKEQRLNNQQTELGTTFTDIKNESKYDPHLNPQFIRPGSNFQSTAKDKQEENISQGPLLRLGSMITQLQQIESMIGVGK
jgi:hypothetical protein